MHKSQEAVTTKLGGFEMNVDRGLYDVQVKAPSETGFAWLVEPELVMSGRPGASVSPGPPRFRCAASSEAATERLSPTR